MTRLETCRLRSKRAGFIPIMPFMRAVNISEWPINMDKYFYTPCKENVSSYIDADGGRSWLGNSFILDHLSIFVYLAFFFCNPFYTPCPILNSRTRSQETSDKPTWPRFVSAKLGPRPFMENPLRWRPSRKPWLQGTSHDSVCFFCFVGDFTSIRVIWGL